MRSIIATLERVPLRVKLILILAVPAVALLAYSWVGVTGRMRTVDQMSSLGELSDLAVHISAFVHETQKERGASGVYMGSGGTTFGDRLADQRATTDEKLGELDAFIAGFGPASFGVEFSGSFGEAARFRDRLDGHRRNVDQLSITNAEGIGFYTQMNATQLAVIEHISGLSDDASLARLISAYVNFLQGKERAGQERAVMSTVFATGHFEGNFFNRFAQLVTEQNTYERVFASFATEEQLEYFEQTVTGTPVDEVERMRTVAFAGSTAADLGVEGGYWFDTITAKINLLKDVEDRLSADLVASAGSLQSDAQSGLLVQGGLAVALLAITVGGSVLIGTAIAAPLRRLATAADNIARGDVNQKVEVESNDAVGEMATAFEGMVSYLQEASAAAERIADGDLTVDVQPQSEHDALGHAFASMVENLRALIGSTGETAAGLVRRKESLALSADQAASATQEVANTTTQVAEGTSLQARSVEEINGSVRGLVEAINGVAQGAREQEQGVEEASRVSQHLASSAEELASSATEAAGGAREAADSAEGGARKVEETIAGIDRIKQTIDQASGEIARLGERSQEIGKIVAVIEDIAAQTNLLALNAAIEAARAGEQGRGFAVVADEVRQLAERVSSATQEIAELINGVQSGVDASVRAMEEGATEMDSGARVATEAGESLAQILEAAHSVATRIQSMAEGSTELREAGGEMARLLEGVRAVAEQSTEGAARMQEQASAVSDGLGAIATVAEENSAATEQVSASAEEMTAQVEEVSAATHALGQIADELRAEVAKFRLPVGRQLAVVPGAGAEGARGARPSTAAAGSTEERYWAPTGTD